MTNTSKEEPIEILKTLLYNVWPNVETLVHFGEVTKDMDFSSVINLETVLSNKKWSIVDKLRLCNAFCLNDVIEDEKVAFEQTKKIIDYCFSKEDENLLSEEFCINLYLFLINGNVELKNKTNLYFLKSFINWLYKENPIVTKSYERLFELIEENVPLENKVTICCKKNNY